MKTLLSVLLAVAIASQSNAIELQTSVMGVYQEGNGPLVRHGHVAHARTNYNRLSAGGTYVIACSHQMTNLPVTGGRSLYTENLIGGLRLDVTIPAQLPARSNMPGFSALPRGTTIPCTYNWTSTAIEGGLMVGAGGTSFQTGNGAVSQSGTKSFFMNVPGTSLGEDNTVCIP